MIIKLGRHKMRHWGMRNGKYGKFDIAPGSKLIRLIVAGAFLFNTAIIDLAWAREVGPVLSPVGAAADSGPGHSLVDGIKIPQEFGSIKETFKGGSDKLIIQVQDIHSNYEGQKNLANILISLIESYGLRVVMIEGGITDRDFSYLRMWHSLKERKEKAEKLLKEGVITGEAYVNIATDYPLAFQGAEDRILYERNMEAFTKAQVFAEDGLLLVKRLKSISDNLKRNMYNRALKNFDKKLTAYHNEQLGFTEYLVYLKRTARDHDIKLKAFKHYRAIMGLIDLEEKINFGKVEVERDDLIESITDSGSDRAAVEMLYVKGTDFKEGKIGQNEFYNYLIDIAKSSKIALRDYENLTQYVEYINEYANLDISKLFEDINELEDQITVALCRNNDEKTLAQISKNVGILEKFMQLKLIPQDFAYFKTNKDDFYAKDWLKFLRIRSAKFELSTPVPDDVALIDDNIPTLESFYNAAIDRDKAFVENSIKKMEREKENFSCLIAGGFHTQNLTQLFKQKGISYVVIAPKASLATNDKTYKKELKESYANRIWDEINPSLTAGSQLRRVGSFEDAKSSSIVAAEFGDKDVQTVLRQRLPEQARGELVRLIQGPLMIVMGDAFLHLWYRANRLGRGPELMSIMAQIPVPESTLAEIRRLSLRTSAAQATLAEPEQERLLATATVFHGENIAVRVYQQALDNLEAVREELGEKGKYVNNYQIVLALVSHLSVEDNPVSALKRRVVSLKEGQANKTTVLPDETVMALIIAKQSEAGSVLADNIEHLYNMVRMLEGILGMRLADETKFQMAEHLIFVEDRATLEERVESFLDQEAVKELEEVLQGRELARFLLIIQPGTALKTLQDISRIAGEMAAELNDAFEVDIPRETITAQLIKQHDFSNTRNLLITEASNTVTSLNAGIAEKLDKNRAERLDAIGDNLPLPASSLDIRPPLALALLLRSKESPNPADFSISDHIIDAYVAIEAARKQLGDFGERVDDQQVFDTLLRIGLKHKDLLDGLGVEEQVIANMVEQPVNPELSRLAYIRHVTPDRAAASLAHSYSQAEEMMAQGGMLHEAGISRDQVIARLIDQEDVENPGASFEKAVEKSVEDLRQDIARQETAQEPQSSVGDDYYDGRTSPITPKLVATALVRNPSTTAQELIVQLRETRGETMLARVSPRGTPAPRIPPLGSREYEDMWKGRKGPRDTRVLVHESDLEKPVYVISHADGREISLATDESIGPAGLIQSIGPEENIAFIAGKLKRVNPYLRALLGIEGSVSQSNYPFLHLANLCGANLGREKEDQDVYSTYAHFFKDRDSQLELLAVLRRIEAEEGEIPIRIIDVESLPEKSREGLMEVIDAFDFVEAVIPAQLAQEGRVIAIGYEDEYIKARPNHEYIVIDNKTRARVETEGLMVSAHSLLAALAAKQAQLVNTISPEQLDALLEDIFRYIPIDPNDEGYIDKIREIETQGKLVKAVKTKV